MVKRIIVENPIDHCRNISFMLIYCRAGMIANLHLQLFLYSVNTFSLTC
jgi:hypothetical protein